MGLIKMTPEQMNKRANDYRNESAKFEEVIGNMTRLVGLLQEEWKGEASVAYAQRFDELKPSFEKANQLILEIADSLDKSAEITAETDAQIASSYRA